MKRDLVAIDASCLIAIQAEEELGEHLKSLLKTKWTGFCTEYSILETYYVLCRKFGWNAAVEKLKSLKESNVLQIEPFSSLLEAVAQLKCQRAIAVGDCFTITLAKKINGQAIFYNKESEVEKAMKKQPFDVEIKFLEDLIDRLDGKTQD